MTLALEEVTGDEAPTTDFAWFRVARVISAGTPAQMPIAVQMGRVANSDRRTLITLRLIYTDGSPDYCSASAVRSGMWCSDKAADIFSASSYGAMTWDQSAFRVIDVQMGSQMLRTCDQNTAMRQADQKAREQHGVDVSTTATRNTSCRR